MRRGIDTCTRKPEETSLFLERAGYPGEPANIFRTALYHFNFQCSGKSRSPRTLFRRVFLETKGERPHPFQPSMTRVLFVDVRLINLLPCRGTWTVPGVRTQGETRGRGNGGPKTVSHDRVGIVHSVLLSAQRHPGSLIFLGLIAGRHAILSPRVCSLFCIGVLSQRRGIESHVSV